MNPLQVVFDYQVFCLQQYGGISRYYTNLCRYLAEQDGVDARVLAWLHINRYLEHSPCRPAWSKLVSSPKFPLRVLKWANTAAFDRYVGHVCPSIVHRTYHYRNNRLQPRTKVVTTVFDMIHERFPSDFVPSDWTVAAKARDVANADLVICISECTSRDLQEIHGVAKDKIRVVYLGVSPVLSDSCAELGPLPPFILYVGRRDGYKNFSSLLKAYGMITSVHKDFAIVCFGGGPLTEVESRLIKALQIPSERIRQVSGDDTLLAAYYNKASLLVLPSLYEGFGLPILEAMAHGCPVACSNRGSLPEVAGGAAVYFDPHEFEDISEKIQKVLYGVDITTALIESGRLRAANFSWNAALRKL